jgi:hypothetical protein
VLFVVRGTVSAERVGAQHVNAKAGTFKAGGVRGAS